MLKNYLLPFFCVLLSGCIITTQTKSTYDINCDKFRKKVEMKADWIVFKRCGNSVNCDGVNHMAFGALLGVISGIVSTTVMIFGNTYYAINESGECKVKIEDNNIEEVDEPLKTVLAN